jgi:probable rRNA maturation factor
MEKKFSIIKNDILGRNYSLSIAYVSEKTSKEINKKYRGKNKPTNILSFPLGKNLGEILLCLPVIKREAKKFNKTSDQFLNFLVIHGILHLKGLSHSSTMEERENFYDQKYFGGNRHRLNDDPSRGRRIHQRRKKS